MAAERESQGDEQFLTWRPGAPAFLNSLTEIEFGMGLWVLTGDSPIQLEIPDSPEGAEGGDRVLSEGFNLVAWLGSESNTADQFARLGDVLNGAWAWDAASTSFLTFFPDAPAILNSLDTLAFGNVLWVSVSADSVWNVCGATAFPNVCFDGNPDRPFVSLG